MLLHENHNHSIFEPRMGFPVYYHSSGYMPSTPPYGGWEQHHPQPLSHPVLSAAGFTKSERDPSASPSPMVYQKPLVYPQFPTPPLSVSPGPSPPPAAGLSSKQERPGDSFQIKRLLNLEGPRTDYYHEDRTNNLLAMRTASVIMKIEDQRVFQVDSTTPTSLTDEDSSFEHHHHHHHQYNSSTHDSGASTASIAAAAASTETLFICKWEKCYKVFCHLNDLAGHVTQAHGTAPMGSVNYYCKWEGCPRTDRGFNARYKMLVHIRTHTKEKPHQCPECFKCFSRAENLKIHIRSHSGEKPYVCPVEGCNKAYSNSSDRFKHTRTHSMTKPYQCKVPGCNKRYTDPSSLRKHVKTYKHKTSNPHLMDEEALMQERITSTSDDMEEKPSPIEEEHYYSKPQSPKSCSSLIDQQMTDLDIQERSPCYCRHDKLSVGIVGEQQKQQTNNSYEERLKMYRLGAIFNVNPAHCDVLVSSSRPESCYSTSYTTTLLKDTSPMDLEAPLDLSVRQK